MSLLGLSLLFFPLNYEGRYLRTENQTIEAIHTQNYSLGAEVNRWRGIFEYSTYTSNSGNASYGFRHEHRDLIGGLGYNILEGHFVALKELQWKLYGEGLFGTYRESVTTTFLGSSQKDQGMEKWTSGLGGGGGLRYKYVVVEAEMRALFGDSYDPQPNWSYIVRLGIQIPIGSGEKKSIRPSPENKKPGVVDRQASIQK